MQLPEPSTKSPGHKAARAAVRRLEAGTVRTLCLLGDPEDICAPAVAFYAVGSHNSGNRYGVPWCDMHAPSIGIPDKAQMECVEKAPVVVFYKAHGYVDIIALENFVALVLGRHAVGLQTIITTRHANFADVCRWLVDSGLPHATVVPLFGLFTTPEALAISIFDDAAPPSLPAHAVGTHALR